MKKLSNANSNVANDRPCSIEDYERVYDEVISLSIDAEAFSPMDMMSDEDVERAKWLCLILDVLNDVPKRRMNYLFQHAGLDPDEVLEEMFDRIYAND